LSITRVVVLIALLWAAPHAASASSGEDELARAGREPHLGRKVYDLLLLRPLGLVQLAAGAVVFVPSWPVSLLVGAGDEVYHQCLELPIDTTFRKPLGRL